jgi:hypothetical protein
MFVRKVASRSSQPATDIEQPHSRPHTELFRECHCRLPAADVKLINRGKILLRKAVHILARRRERVQYRFRERPVRVVPDHCLFDLHHVAPWFNCSRSLVQL